MLIDNLVNETDSSSRLNSEKSKEVKIDAVISKFDIGRVACQIEQISILKIVDNVWKPPDTFGFPRLGSRNLRFQYSLYARFNLLAHSTEHDGAFYLYCVAFGIEHGGNKETTL